MEYGVNSCVSLIRDFLLFGIPFIVLQKLDMPRNRKIRLVCIMLRGVLLVVSAERDDTFFHSCGPSSSAIAIYIGCLVFVILGQQDSDMTGLYTELIAIEVSEIGATLAALSVPGMKPLVDTSDEPPAT